MSVLKLPRFEDVPQIARFLEGTHNYDMDKHTRLIYHPISGIVYKRRFVMAMEMLAKCANGRTGCIVEVGYGAGLLLPMLSDMARKVVGVNLLDTRASAAVRGMLERLRIDNVMLLRASVLDMPLAANSVDALLCLSVLEHLQPGDDLERAAAAIVRVLRPGGVAVLGFPVKNFITRALFKILGYDDAVIHPSSHADVFAGFQRRDFRFEATRVLPAFLPMNLGLYALAQMRKGV